jgi:uncharacterized protein YceK
MAEEAKAMKSGQVASGGARMVPRGVIGAGLACALLSLTACGSLLDVTHPQSRCHIYGGVRSDWEMVDRGEGPWRKVSTQPLCAFLDFPLSIVVDTAILPVTALEFLLSDYSSTSAEGPEGDHRCRRCGDSASLRR